MRDTVIKVENVSKQYRLGQVGTGSVTHDINRWWYKVRGKEDPYLKIGEANDRTQKGTSEYVWALKDIDFEVKQGEILGIIGRNGAGKSTLLKILSRTTLPTTGSIKAKGRIASLLEVGTGFHPELSGRDNIFLNGAILGMTKNEIKRKFDEIVDFAGVERYIDTPVKRYSSGMYVRLAFAVAAHLEPEILIVDEVLAVGDSEFQKKCLGKMKDVSVNEGRTILFVSHNMPAIKTLCNKGLLLRNGQTDAYGEIDDIIQLYKKNNLNSNSSYYNVEDQTNIKPGNADFKLLQLSVKSTRDDSEIDIESGFILHAKFENYCSNKRLGISFVIKNDDDQVMCELFCELSDGLNSKAGGYDLNISVPGFTFNSGTYMVDIIFAESQRYVLWEVSDIVSFDIESVIRTNAYSLNRLPGILRPNYNLSLVYETVTQ